MAEVQAVIEVVKDAFQPSNIESSLTGVSGRVFGSVTVIGSKLFDELDDTRRQARLWKYLHETLGDESSRVGPIVLEPTARVEN